MEYVNWCILHVHVFSIVARASQTNSTLFLPLRTKEKLNRHHSASCDTVAKRANVWTRPKNIHSPENATFVARTEKKQTSINN